MVDSRERLRRALGVLTSWDHPCEAWLFTGDLADDGQTEAYEFLAETVLPAAASVGVKVWWVNGNHDDRAGFRAALLGELPGDQPLNQEWWLGGLRVLGLDTNVPGEPHGLVAAESLAWLAERLSVPAPEGTLLALHHTPLPVVQDAAALWDLRHAADLAAVLRGTDVRLVLGGHFHQPGHGTFAGLPVTSCTSLAYTQDLTAGRTLRGQAGGTGFTLVQVYDDQVVTTVVALDASEAVHHAIDPSEARERLVRLG